MHRRQETGEIVRRLRTEARNATLPTEFLGVAPLGPLTASVIDSRIAGKHTEETLRRGEAIGTIQRGDGRRRFLTTQQSRVRRALSQAACREGYRGDPEEELVPSARLQVIVGGRW